MKEYSKIIKVHPVLLYKDDLIELEKIFISGLLPKEGDLEIIITEDDSHIDGKSFMELFSQPQPKQTDTLEIRGYGRSDNEIIKSISVNFYSDGTYCHVFSIEETWFLGIISKLKSFFIKRKPWYAWLNVSMPYLLGIFSGLSLITFIWGYSVGLRWSLVFVLFFFISIIIIGVLSLQEKLFPHVKIIFSQKTNHKLNYELIAIILNMAILLATIASIVIPLNIN